jgi:SAM-dependent methyltransferase
MARSAVLNCVTKPVDSSVYYRGILWNSFDEVVAHIHTQAWGSPHGNWIEYVVRRRGGQPFDRVLSLNCGNGWLERGLIEFGLAREVVAIDVMPDLLDAARQASVGMPIEYHLMDTNIAGFPPGPYDAVVNHAAGHHIARLDRVFRAAAEALEPGGTLLTWDYTGHHRNQYGERMWDAACAVNESLPRRYRSPMGYPHLPTMLAVDPTEAIHSELVLPVTERYFEHEHLAAIGGSIGYLVLSHNEALYDAPAAERSAIVRTVLEHDEADLAAHPEDSLFTFAISRLRDLSTISEEQLGIWEREELARESAVVGTGGHYHLPTPVALRTYPERRPWPPVAAESSSTSSSPFRPSPQPTVEDIASRGVRFATRAFLRSWPVRARLALDRWRGLAP